MDALVPEIPGENDAAAKSPARGRPELQGLVDDVSPQLDRSAAAILGLLAAEAGEPVSKDALLEVGWQGRLVHENSLAKAIGSRSLASDRRMRNSIED